MRKVHQELLQKLLKDAEVLGQIRGFTREVPEKFMREEGWGHFTRSSS